MITGRWTGRRAAALAAGAVLAGSMWTGVAAAAPAADQGDCQDQANEVTSLLKEFAQGQGELGGILKGIGLGENTTDDYNDKIKDLLGQQAEINKAQRELVEDCSGSTTTTAPTSTSATPTSTTAAGSGTVDRDCKDFTSQTAAQQYFDSIGGSASNNADRLDRNSNGTACEDYDYGTVSNVTAAPTAGITQTSVVPTGGVATGDGSFGE